MGIRVMLVDDDEHVRRTIRRVLEKRGYEVVEEVDGHAALRHVAGDPPDLVISDVYMPEMDGVEFVMRLRETFPEVPIIAISGGGLLSKEAVLGAAASLGAQTVLEKPVDAQDLLDAVELAVGSPDGVR